LTAAATRIRNFLWDSTLEFRHLTCSWLAVFNLADTLKFPPYARVRSVIAGCLPFQFFLYDAQMGDFFCILIGLLWHWVVSILEQPIAQPHLQPATKLTLRNH
jgi:hypothetical protein